MKLGIEVKIDVRKIEKMRLYKGEKCTYLTMTTFIDTEEKDQYGNNGFISHKADQNEERAPILGNCRLFWSDENQNQNFHQNEQPKPTPHEPKNLDDFDDDEIPF